MTPQAQPRQLGFGMAVALVMGNMIGSGVFLLPAALAPFGGLSIAGWVASAAGATCLALVFARLARLSPAAGGPYAYTRQAFGDVPAFLVAWGYWISVWASLAALAVAGVGYLDPFIPGIVRAPALAALLAVAIVWLVIGINIMSIRRAGYVQVVTTVVKVLPLALVGVGGMFFVSPEAFAVQATGPREVAGGVTAVATLTLWAFLGLECATIPAGNIANPERTIPRATVVGTVLTAGVYIVSTVGIMSLVPADVLSTSTAPFAEGARALFGHTAAQLMALGAAVSCFGALNGWTVVVGQLPLAVARDGLFPTAFTNVSAAGTPVAGTVIAGVLATLLIAMNHTRGLVDLVTFIVLMSTLATLIPYTFCSLATFRLGRDRLTTGMRIVAGLAFSYSLWAIGGAGPETVYWGFLLLMAGLPVFVFVRRRV
ncbi:MAG: amino acid permease [Acidimicrobiia bacterium]|nr:amino acid permease [Acidimicrobiia bacterium]